MKLGNNLQDSIISCVEAVHAQGLWVSFSPSVLLPPKVPGFLVGIAVTVHD